MSRWRFFWSNGLRWHGERYLLFFVLFGLEFEIRKPRWFWEWQNGKDYPA